MPVVSILGAGPFGLAATAHLKAIGVDAGLRRTCPLAGNMLRWHAAALSRIASSISDPAELDLDGFSAATGVPVGSPVPLETFIQYGRWFQTQAVPQVDRRRVERVQRAKGRFMLNLADGERVTTESWVVAAGIAAFAHVPRAFRGLPTEPLRTHRSTATRLLLRTAGARRRLWAERAGVGRVAARAWRRGGYRRRAPAVRWLNQRPWLRELGPCPRCCTPHPRSAPPLPSQLVRVPGLCTGCRPAAGTPLDRRSIRPAGAGWLKPRIDGKVTIHNGQFVTAVKPAGDRVAVTFNDGGRDIVDHAARHGVPHRPGTLPVPGR